MNDTYLDLPARIAENFMEIDNDIVMYLRKNDEEFAALDAKITTMSSQNYYISQVLSGTGEIHLTAEEHAILVQYLKLVFERDNMERQEIYFRGQMDAMAYLKRIKAF